MTSENRNTQSPHCFINPTMNTH